MDSLVLFSSLFSTVERILKRTLPLWIFGVLSACSVQPGAQPLALPSPPPSTAFAEVNQPITPTPASLPTETSQSESVLTLWHGVSGEKALALYEVVALFQEQYPSIHVNLDYLPQDDLLKGFLTRSDSENSPGLLLGPGEWGAELSEAGRVAELSGFASDELAARLNPAALQIVSREGALIGLPLDLRGVVMFRNTAILPDAPTDFAGLIESARSATQGSLIGAYLERGGLYGVAQLSACGGELIDAEGRPAFANQAGLCWLDLLRSFEEAGPAAYETDDDLERFISGKIGLILEGTWSIDVLKESLDGSLAIDPWPAYGNRRLTGYVWTDAVFVSAHLPAADQDAAWKFVEFLVGEEAQTIFSEFGYIPAALDVQVADPLMRQSIQALEGGVMFPSLPNYFWDSLDQAMKSVLSEGKDPAVALQNAAQQISANQSRNK